FLAPDLAINAHHAQFWLHILLWKSQLRLRVGRKRIKAEEVASGGFGLFEKLDAPITIHQGIGVVLRRFVRIPSTHVNDARILEDFESLEIRFLDAAKFLGGLADPGLHGAF